MIVAIAAEMREFSGLLRRASAQRPVNLPLRFARRATFAGAEWLLAAHGPGPALAAFAVEAALGSVSATAVLSTGMCGGLAQELRPGDIFVAGEVASPAGRWTCRRPLSSRKFFHGLLWSEDRVACSTAEKASLRLRGADAVEMEAASVAAAAARHDLPFYCVRSVSDDASDSLSVDFNRYRDAEGRFRAGRIALAASARPWLVPGLVRLARHARLAVNNLGEFLADCAFTS